MQSTVGSELPVQWDEVMKKLNSEYCDCDSKCPKCVKKVKPYTYPYVPYTPPYQPYYPYNPYPIWVSTTSTQTY